MKKLLLILLCVPLIGFCQLKGGSDNLSSHFIDSLNKLILTNPDDINLYYSRGQHYKDGWEFRKAIEDFSMIIELNPNDAYAYCLRGNCSRELENYGNAKSDFTKAIEIDSKFYDRNDHPYYEVLAWAYLCRGIMYSELGKDENAIADYTSAIKVWPEYGFAYRNRGIKKRDLGMPYCVDFRICCELDQEHMDCCIWKIQECE